MSYPHAAQKVENENQAVEVLETKQLREATASAPRIYRHRRYAHGQKHALPANEGRTSD